MKLNINKLGVKINLFSVSVTISRKIIVKLYPDLSFFLLSWTPAIIGTSLLQLLKRRKKGERYLNMVNK